MNPPSTKDINEAPEPWRTFILELETRTDPAGEVRELLLTREENKQLRALVAELVAPSSGDEQMWTLPLALEYIRQLQPVAQAYGYCLTLGGGVLNKGLSNHDLDIVCHCRCDTSDVCDPTAFLLSLTTKHWFALCRQTQAGPHCICKGVVPMIDNRIAEFWFVYHYSLGEGMEMLMPKRFGEVVITPQGAIDLSDMK